MRLRENILLALAALRANKMRSFLTMLGIIIGIAAVITIMSLGASMLTYIEDTMQDIGANNVMVNVTASEDEDDPKAIYAQPSEQDYITDEMIDSYAATYPDQINAIVLSQIVGSGQIEIGNLYANISVNGINSDNMTSQDLTILAGRELTAKDYAKGKRVAVVSDKLVDNLYAGDAEAAIGQTIDATLENNFYQYTIVGVYEYEASAFEFMPTSEKDITTNVYIPLQTARDQLHISDGVINFSVVTATGIDSTEFAVETERYFNSFYRHNQEFEISASSMESMVDTIIEMTSMFSLVLSIIAAISLLVGGIGVMNIMLVSITERTREIGTCKALGATNTSIRVQFITEAIILCLIGGIIGLGLGLIFGAVGANLLGYAAQVSISSIIVALAFSMGIGIFFGYYPANKAAKMNPIDALRYE